jgi:cytochrome c oxidase subunit IV
VDETHSAADLIREDSEGPEVDRVVVGVADAPPTSDPHAEEHPDDGVYVRVAAILAIVTAVEVGLYYTDLSGISLVAILMGLATIKFGMVVAYFMHLRFDARLLRRLFVTGVLLAGFVFSIALVTLDILLK